VCDLVEIHVRSRRRPCLRRQHRRCRRCRHRHRHRQPDQSTWSRYWMDLRTGGLRSDSSLDRVRRGTACVPIPFIASANIDCMLYKQIFFCEIINIPPGFATWISYLAWVEYVTLQLDHTDTFERIRALRRLGRLTSSALAGYVPAVVRKLTDNHRYVRKRALQILGTLETDVLAKYAPDVVVQLSLTDLHRDTYTVRCAALETLGKLKPCVLNLYAPAIARQLEVDDVILELGAHEVRCDALRTLGQLDASALASYAPAVVRRFDDPYWFVRLAALKTLYKLELSVLTLCAPMVAVMLNDGDDEVKQEAALLLDRLRWHSLI